MNETELPAGTRLHGGVLVIEEFLRREDKALIYRASDLPTRSEVLLSEYFPETATRNGREVLAPNGWSAQGFQIAREKWAQSFQSSNPDTLFTFTENNTLYTAREYSAYSTNPHATVVLGQAAPIPIETRDPVRAEIPEAAPSQPARVLAPSSPAQTPNRNQFSLRDVWPDALRGALQGAFAGAAGGVLLGAIAATLGSEEIITGAARGLWALPVGAAAGALLGTLRALPSNAPQLASASPRTREDQIQSTLSGAGKGAIMGLVLGGGFLLLAAIASGGGVSLLGLFQSAFLFALLGAFAGGIVGFIRINPRDRSRR